jgi:hypothetical protein
MVYIKIHENTVQAKAVIAMLKTMPFVELVKDKLQLPNAATRKAINDARQGKVIKVKNVSDLMKKLRS